MGFMYPPTLRRDTTREDGHSVREEAGYGLTDSWPVFPQKAQLYLRSSIVSPFSVKWQYCIVSPFIFQPKNVHLSVSVSQVNSTVNCSI
jgi:hypothetical protein